MVPCFRLAAVASLAFAAPVLTAADEATIEHPKAPPAVLATVDRAYPGANLTDCDRSGTVAYEVKLIDATGAKRTLHVSSDGTLLPEPAKTPDQRAADAASDRADRAGDEALVADQAAERAENAAARADRAMGVAHDHLDEAADAAAKANLDAGQADQAADRAEHAADRAVEAADRAAQKAAATK
jgi:hypothetical protein